MEKQQQLNDAQQRKKHNSTDELHQQAQSSTVRSPTTLVLRFFPLLASAYASRFVGEWLKLFYTDLTQRLQANDFSTLSEVNACTEGLKSLTTTATADGLEECRKLCGGHGYLCSSGLLELFDGYVSACTFEGDNIVLLLHVARFFMKNVSQLGSEKKPAGTIAHTGKIEHLMQCRFDVEQDGCGACVVLI